MGTHIFYTILGGFVSASIGASLFFLQRYLERGDEQMRIIFQIYQLMVIPPVPYSSGNTFELSAQGNIIDEARIREMQTLATRIKDKQLAIEVFSYRNLTEEKKCLLINKVIDLINPKLLRKTEAEK